MKAAIKNLVAFLILGTLTVFAVWVVFSSWVPKTPLGLFGVMAFFIGAPIGNLWMLYHWVMREKPPVAYFLLVFVPYGFVWYYFNRARHLNQISN